MQLETVIYEVKENIARITMNRPEKMNALGYELWDDLQTAFAEAENDPEVRVIILAGNGKSFSSGWDLKGSYYINGPKETGHKTVRGTLKNLRFISEGYLKIMNIPKPVIAQVHGYCLAGGCYLQMLCDIAIASEDAVIGHPAGQGGVDSLPLWISYLGVRKAKELLYNNQVMSAPEAERIGLINRTVPADKLEEEVWKMAKNLTEADPDGIAIQKEGFNAHADITGRGAVFNYHRQLNALQRFGRDTNKTPLSVERSRNIVGEQGL